MENIIIFGINKNPEGLYEHLEEKYNIVGWIDSNESFQHQFVNGKYVYSPDEMDGLSFDKVIVGPAIFGGTRQIYDVCRRKGITAENVITDYVLKCRKMDIKDIFALQHKEGKSYTFENFERMNLLIQYAFVEQYFDKAGKGYELAEKYMRLVCNEERALNHSAYYESLIERMQENCTSKVPDISLNKSGSLIDGTHRLAYYLYVKKDEIMVDVFNTDWNISRGGVRDLEWMLSYSDIFNEQDIQYLREVYDRVTMELGICKTEIRRKSNLW